MPRRPRCARPRRRSRWIPRYVEVLGRMADYVTGTGYRITPVLGLLPPGLVYQPAPTRGRRGVRIAAGGAARSRRAAAPAAPCARRLAGILGMAAPGALYLGRDRGDPGASGAEAAGCGAACFVWLNSRCSWRRSPSSSSGVFAATERGPSMRRAASASAVRCSCWSALLFWLSRGPALPPGTGYAPAQLDEWTCRVRPCAEHEPTRRPAHTRRHSWPSRRLPR